MIELLHYTEFPYHCRHCCPLQNFSILSPTNLIRRYPPKTMVNVSTTVVVVVVVVVVAVVVVVVAVVVVNIVVPCHYV